MARWGLPASVQELVQMSLRRPNASPRRTHAAAHCLCAWVDWAAAQIRASLALDHEAMTSLLTAIRTITTVVADAATQSSSIGQPISPLEPIERQADRVIAALQSHDRLSQQLSHVADALQLLGSMAAMVPAPTESDWQAFRQRQLQAFSMREERELFRCMLPERPGDDSAAAADGSPTCAVELFL